MDDSQEVVLALTTFASDTAAAAVVRTLLDRRVIACGTLMPGGRSLYRWEGRIAEDAETVVLFKTVRARVDELKAALLELHSYSTPELLVFDVTNGLPAYLGWVVEQTSTIESP